MRLSELVKMAGDSDPEVLVYTEEGEYWKAERIDPRVVTMTENGLILAADKAAGPVLDWKDGEGANPLRKP